MQTKNFLITFFGFDELILNHEEMKSASNVFIVDESTEEGRVLLETLIGSLDNDNSGSDNYVGFRFGDNSNNDDTKCAGICVRTCFACFFASTLCHLPHAAIFVMSTCGRNLIQPTRPV